MSRFSRSTRQAIDHIDRQVEYLREVERTSDRRTTVYRNDRDDASYSLAEAARELDMTVDEVLEGKHRDTSFPPVKPKE